MSAVQYGGKAAMSSGTQGMARNQVDNLDMEALRQRRLCQWRQTAETRLPGPEAAAELIERAGIATLFPASPELPNLYHAYSGDAGATVASEWDSPAGEVYTWRWVLGRRAVAFYTAIVRNRPTWVSWRLLPALLRLRGELRALDEVFDGGEISEHAYRVAQALEESGGVLGTGELRRQAGFPTGKTQRAAYLKAVEELDTRLLLAKVFGQDDEEMRHALVGVRYPEHVAAAERLSRADALDQMLAAYLPSAVYAVPTPLARHLKLPEAELRAGLNRLVDAGHAVTTVLPGQSGVCYVWTDV